ncbi:MAG: DUF3300 domain-containing protein [Acidobacteriaceae bacterium]|jgi:hypothetical protein
MNALPKHRSRLLAAALTLSVATLAVAQAPIVRQPPSSPPPGYDQQAPAQPDQQNYPQQAQPYPPSTQPQDQAAPPPLPPGQLDGLVNRIALYPDPLLAQTLTAATYWDEIPDAAAWADEHSYLKGDALSAAIQSDNLPWDPSVLALLPFPSVLDMMARDPNWTGQLGNAVLGQREDVMDAVQRLRREAYGYGYLQSNSDVDVIDQGGYVEIEPFNPYLFYVPVYDPLIVFGAPRPGFFIGGAIRFGPAVTLGVSFGRFGWFGSGFGWGSHAILIDHRPWVRTYANRGAYVHPYAHPYVRPAAPRVEEHHAAPPPRASAGRRR